MKNVICYNYKGICGYVNIYDKRCLFQCCLLRILSFSSYKSYSYICISICILSVFLIVIHYVIWLVGGNSPLKGDLLVIAGSILYAVSNVSEVRIVFSFPFCFYNLFQSAFLVVLHFMRLFCSMERYASNGAFVPYHKSLFKN